MVKRCAAYIRVSTDLQAAEIEGSLKTQRQRLEEEIARRSTPECQWRIVEVYEERARSGKDTNRPEFQRMLADIRNGLIDVVCCTELSRVSRSVIDFLNFTKLLQEYRCDFLCLKQNFDTTTASGKLLITVTVALAEFEREQISERTKVATFARAMRGLWNGGVILGYDRDHQRKSYRTVNPKEADLVRQIFKWYVEHASFAKVRDLVNQAGYRTKPYTSRSGRYHPPRPFIKSDIRYLLSNFHYVGLKEVNKCRKPLNQLALKPEERYQIVKAVWEPIVDEATFWCVQELIARNARTHHNSFAEPTQYTYLLGNERVRCGECKSVMTTAWSKGRRAVYPYYVCTAIDKRGTRSCSVRRVSATALDALIRARIRQLAQAPALCADLVRNTNRLFVDELGPLRQRRTRLERTLTEVDGQAKALLAQVVNNGCDGLYYVRETLREFEERHKQFEGELATVSGEIGRYEHRQVKADVVQRGLTVLDEVLEELIPAERKRVFELVVKEVVYTPTQVTLTLYELPFVSPQDVKTCWFGERCEWLAD